jgi:N,N'-diacetylchitobiose non-reducing end deacetylase
MTIGSIIPIPNIFEARRILCIQPHYDDNDIAAGGTLARLAKNGAELYYLTTTDDLMGVVDTSLSKEAAAQALKRDQYAAGKIIGIKEQFWCSYPDAGEYSHTSLRRDFLKHIRMLKPDFIFTTDPWLTYEAHRDHVQTGLAAAEAAILAGVVKIPSSDPKVDEAYEGHDIQGVAFYFTREPNYIADITSTWETKLAAMRCYEAQFDPQGMEKLLIGVEAKSRQVVQGKPFAHGEPLKIFHPSALHAGI